MLIMLGPLPLSSSINICLSYAADAWERDNGLHN
jgi:hypothetical protein